MQGINKKIIWKKTNDKIKMIAWCEHELKC